MLDTNACPSLLPREGVFKGQREVVKVSSGRILTLEPTMRSVDPLSRRSWSLCSARKVHSVCSQAGACRVHGGVHYYQGELWAFRERFGEETVCELSRDRQQGFGQGMWEGRCPRQREPQKLRSQPRSGKTRGVTGASGDSGASTQDSGTAGEGPGTVCHVICLDMI